MNLKNLKNLRQGDKKIKSSLCMKYTLENKEIIEGVKNDHSIEDKVICQSNNLILAEDDPYIHFIGINYEFSCCKNYSDLQEGFQGTIVM